MSARAATGVRVGAEAGRGVSKWKLASSFRRPPADHARLPLR